MARTRLHLIIEELLTDYAPKIQDAFLEMIQDISDSVILGDLVRAIKENDPEKAFRLLGMSDAALRPIIVMIEEAFAQGGMLTAAAFPKRVRTAEGVRFRFNVRDTRAERWLRDMSGTLITDLKEKVRVTVLDTLTKGVEEGANPRKVALDLIGRIDPATGTRTGGTIGLTPGQKRWVNSTEQDLRDLNPRYLTRELRGKRFDSIVERAIENKTPLTEDQITKLTSQYRNNALRYRGEAIGRSEAIEALNQGQHESLKQAVENGAISQSAVQRFWDSAGIDGRTRDSHAAMDGTAVGLDEPFAFPSGANVMFPGDSLTATGDPKAVAAETIQCRCRVRIEIDWFAGVS